MKHTILEYPNCNKFLSKKTDFEFSQPELFLAMAHAQIRIRMTAQQAWNRVVSGYLELHEFFDSRKDFLLHPMYYKSFKDSILTSYSAKIGDAFGLILMEELGLTYFVHFEDLGLKAGRKKRPDYWFYNPKTDWSVLLECKGTTQQKFPTKFFDKTVPEGATQQIEPWLPLRIGSSMTTEGVCVGALVNQHYNGLLTKVVMVKPRGFAKHTGLFPSSALLEHHYGRWLLALGFPNMARALIRRQLYNRTDEANRAREFSSRGYVRRSVSNLGLGMGLTIGLEQQIFEDLVKAVQVVSAERSAWLQEALSERFGQQSQLPIEYDDEEQPVLQLGQRVMTREDNAPNMATRRDGTMLIINQLLDS